MKKLIILFVLISTPAFAQDYFFNAFASYRQKTFNTYGELNCVLVKGFSLGVVYDQQSKTDFLDFSIGLSPGYYYQINNQTYLNAHFAMLRNSLKINNNMDHSFKKVASVGIIESIGNVGIDLRMNHDFDRIFFTMSIVAIF